MKKFFYLFLVLVVAFSALPVFAQAVKKVKVTKSIRKGPDTRWSVEMTGDEIKLYKWEEATPYTIVFKNDKTGELVQIFDKFSEFVAVSQANRPVNLKKDIGRIDSPNPVIRVNNFSSNNCTLCRILNNIG